jgi:subtilisin family serine protease
MKGILVSLVIMSVSVFASDIKKTNFDSTRLIVKLNNNKSIPKSDYAVRSKKLFGNVYVFETNNLERLERELKNNPSVEYVQKNYRSEKSKMPEAKEVKEIGFKFSNAFNDPQAGSVWAFRDANQNGVSVDRSYLAPLSRQKSPVIVAVVDTGVDYNHEDLRDVMWVNENEIPGNGIDDDNNGYIDDVHGINTLVRDSQGNATGDPIHSHAHGTHVSGTIAATQNNGVGIAGIASNVKIMAIRTVPDTSDETDVDVIESFVYAAEHGAKIINCSFGKKVNEGGMAVSEAIDHIANEYGTLVIAAAGNDSSFFGKHDIDLKPRYPASFANESLLVVASTTSSGGLSSFSNVGKVGVDVAAPGSSVYSTMPGNRYASMSGTSMASPTTAGVAAEILSHFPELGPVELKQVLIDSVSKVGSFERYMVSGGRVDLYQGLRKALSTYDN